MSDAPNKSNLRSIGMVAWALFTLVLFFCVLLLANELMKSGRNPLELAENVDGLSVPVTPSAPSASELRDVPIYVASADGRMLLPERRSIPFGEFTVENCRAALDELRKPSNTGSNMSVLPASAEYNALFLTENGELVIDFVTSSLQTTAKSTGSEALMVYGIVNSLTQDVLRAQNGGPVKTVRFLFGGEAPGESFPAHFDLSQPIAPNAAWILKTEATQ
ncbi:MAG TPA: GerMN domain-containing protein [Candidatus Hydrogenedentes bacterium]|nr:GerMN domain-containing protein [Candidatus Hydrogenedentota bacterium]HRK33617.1 GerMN domain-containing protein [Candidatus Hydrogenedentota bacterium]